MRYHALSRIWSRAYESPTNRARFVLFVFLFVYFVLFSFFNKTSESGNSGLGDRWLRHPCVGTPVTPGSQSESRINRLCFNIDIAREVPEAARFAPNSLHFFRVLSNLRAHYDSSTYAEASFFPFSFLVSTDLFFFLAYQVPLRSSWWFHVD